MDFMVHAREQQRAPRENKNNEDKSPDNLLFEVLTSKLL
jgi:hypothetical protein